MMSGVERLRAVAAGVSCDRVPIFCNLLDQGATELGLPLREYYGDGGHVARAQLSMRERFGYDNLWSLFYVGKEAELLGCRHIIYADDGPPNVGEMVLKRWEDVDRLEVPQDLERHPAFQGPAKCLRLLRDKAGGRYPICAYLTASMSLPSILMGMEKWLRLLLEGPADARDSLLRKCCEFFHRELEVYRRLGADIILYSNPFASPDLLPMRLVRELALPWIQRDLEGVAKDGIVFYCGGARMNPVLGEVLERTGIGCYYLSPMDDIPVAARILNGRAMFAGVINDIRLLEWSHEEIRAEVRRIMHEGRGHRGFLFGTLVMPFAIPEDKIRTLMDAAAECGRLRPAGG